MPLVHAANLPDVALLEPGDQTQEVRPGQQGDPDHAGDQLRQAGHHEGALQEAGKPGQSDHPPLNQGVASGGILEGAGGVLRQFMTFLHSSWKKLKSNV